MQALPNSKVVPFLMPKKELRQGLYFSRLGKIKRRCANQCKKPRKTIPCTQRNQKKRKKGVKKIMEQFWQVLIDHIYEICIGAGVILSTIFNKPKTAEQLKKKLNKKIKGIKKRELKMIEKLQDSQNKREKLEKENKND